MVKITVHKLPYNVMVVYSVKITEHRLYITFLCKRNSIINTEILRLWKAES